MNLFDDCTCMFSEVYAHRQQLTNIYCRHGSSSGSVLCQKAKKRVLLECCGERKVGVHKRRGVLSSVRRGEMV